MSWRVLAKCGWDKEAARAAIAGVIRTELDSTGPDDAVVLQPRFLSNRVYDPSRKRSVFQTTVHLPRYCGISPVTGRGAFSLRSARELAAIAAVQVLHQKGDLDDHLRPKIDIKIADYVGAAQGTDWLQTRVAGDRILESSWTMLQTWRKPPDMRLEQNVPLALDIRTAAALQTSGALFFQMCGVLSVHHMRWAFACCVSPAMCVAGMPDLRCLRNLLHFAGRLCCMARAFPCAEMLRYTGHNVLSFQF
jgi:hypothetical protein